MKQPFFLSLVLLTGCMLPPAVIPPMHAPLFEKRGEVTLGAQVQAAPTPRSVHVQGAYAVSDAMYVAAGYSRANWHENPQHFGPVSLSQRGEYDYGELGTAWYRASGTFHLGALASLGYGHSDVQDQRRSWAVFDGRFLRAAVQPSVGYKHKWFGVAVGLRAGLLHYAFDHELHQKTDRTALTAFVEPMMSLTFDARWVELVLQGGIPLLSSGDRNRHAAAAGLERPSSLGFWGGLLSGGLQFRFHKGP